MQLSSLHRPQQYCFVSLISAAIVGMIWVACKHFGFRFLSGYKFKRAPRKQSISRLRNYWVPRNRIKMIKSERQCQDELGKVDWSKVKMVGLDCEWRRRPVALVQLALPNDTCFLIHVCRMKSIPPLLERVLSDRSILKFGVEVVGDAKRISRAFHCQTNGCVDLRDLAVRSGLSNETGSLGLKALTRVLLGLNLPKSYYIQRSDWEAHHLTNSQKFYAASDAAVALDIVNVLVRRKLKDSLTGEAVVETVVAQDGAPVQSRPLVFAQLSHYHPMILHCDKLQCVVQSAAMPTCEKDDCSHNDNFYACLKSLCQGIVDVPHRQKQYAPQPSFAPNCKEPAPTVHKKSSHPVVHQSPYYHNCKLLAPDGTLLSIVDRKKLDWYSGRGLGDMVCDSPPTLKLHFEPKGKPQGDRKFYLAEKEDQCVVCGGRQMFIRKHVVPLEYRKQFPDQMKNHISHDVLLLCPNCHQLSCQQDNRFREYLASCYDAPVSTKANTDVWLQQVKNHARALQSSHNIPDKRVEQLMETLKTYYSLDTITPDMIKEAANIDTRCCSEVLIGHGQKVVEAVIQEDKLMEFQQSWRKHFTDSMNPQFLPLYWSIDHNPS